MIDGLVQSTLEKTNVPVSRTKLNLGPKEAKPNQYITWQMMLIQPEMEADDKAVAMGSYVHLNIFSKLDFTSLAVATKQHMIEAGFYLDDERDGPFDHDKKYYNRVQRYVMIQEVE